MTKRILFFLGLFFSYTHLHSQCEINGTATPPVITCGSCTELSAFGFAEGNLAFGNDFNDGTIGDGWVSTQQATFTNPCGPHPNPGETYLWFGDQSPDPRQVTTEPLDLTLGGLICFDLRYSVQGDAAPCEGPDLPNEGVFLQYSTDGGATWNTIEYFHPNGGYDPVLTEWNTYCFPIPAGAQTGSTQIRWLQDGSSGAQYDHWGMDNVEIYLNDPSYTITWQHDNYTYPNPGGGANPALVCPTETTTYEVVMTDGTNTCNDVVTVIVEDPVFEIYANEDQTVCPGDCAEIDAEAKVIVSPAGIKEFCDGTVQTITGAFGLVENSIEIFVTGLNTDILQSGQLAEVCIDGLQFFGQNFIPPNTGSVDLSSFTITLTCPSGGTIDLVATGDITGQNLNGLGQETCFTLAATQPIGSGSNPYNGDYLPTGGNSLDDFTGCDTEGIWVMTVITNADFGTGFFNGWCLVFDDPEISYQADFWWDPTTNMTNSNTLEPTICPDATTTYTLFAEDENNCLIVSETVTITVDEACCDLDVDFTSVDASCDGDDGSIEVIILDGSGNYTVSWSDSPTTDLIRNNLAPGQYEVTITDVDDDCDRTLTIDIEQDDDCCVLDLDYVVVDASCGESDGSIVVTIIDGTPPYSAVWSDDPTTSLTRTGLPSGQYEVTVFDSECEETLTININDSDGPEITGVNTTAETCDGAGDGTATVQINGNPSDFNISWNTTPAQNGETATGLSQGNYTVTVTDPITSCSSSFDFGIVSDGPCDVECQMTISINSADAGCQGSCNGFISVTVNNGTPPFSYNWSGGVAGANESQALNLCAGSYTVTVTDSEGCSATQQVQITEEVVSISSINASGVSCFGECNGSIQVNSPNATRFSIDGGSNFITSNTFSNLCPGNYTVVVANNDLSCTNSDNVTISEPTQLTVAAQDVNACPNQQVSITATASGGTPPYSYVWSGGLGSGQNHNVTLPMDMSYNITVTDANDCTAQTSMNVFVSDPLNILAIGPQTPVCPGGSAQMSVFVLSGNATSVNWSSNDGSGWTSSELSPIVTPGQNPTTYTVVVTSDCGEVLTEELVVNYYDLPEVTFAGGPIVGCETVETTFFNTTDPSTFSGTCLWDFGDGNTSFDCEQPVHIYTETGCYDVTLTVYSNEGCPSSATNSNMVCVQDGPIADFTFDPLEVDFENPITSFINQSENASTYSWTFGELGTSTLINPKFTFPQENSETYEVCLVANSALGCSDTICKNIYVNAEMFVYVPNAFTPDGDNINDILYVVGNDLHSYNFEFLIFNRWGNRIFESNNPDKGWNGTYNGRMVQQGVYVWRLSLRKKNSSESHVFNGHVTLLR
jgi:gliding motility-associated-like protein